ncbi:hypothetical protein O5O45_15695 [Hahella aquimaris]|uniref:hypothetical protein n=1 Tax=Hahella sp. HNIBRBA332 TaxID=3015983 RepID=UPI00273ADA8F|nr:hypothetical protein [Hahella sp. HNIBRBA332]WLQ17356.1 hypothetical protein O5O45_15695 [Hahella sp. HNIBRBA332]
MNYIQKGVPEVNFYTSMKDVAGWLEIELRDYDWHISDIDGGWCGIVDPSWVLGEEFAAKIEEFDYQFVWAVISAFPKGTEAFTSSLPYVEDNPALWEGAPCTQLDGALFEIVCWDSSATLFIGLSKELSRRLLANAPGIKDLDKENERRGADSC